MSAGYTRPGALRYQNDAGEWIVAQPGDQLYSTVSMMAQQFWDGEAWVECEQEPDDA